MRSETTPRETLPQPQATAPPAGAGAQQQPPMWPREQTDSADLISLIRRQAAALRDQIENAAKHGEGPENRAAWQDASTTALDVMSLADKLANTPPVE